MPGLIQQHWLSPMGSNAVRLAKAAYFENVTRRCIARHG
jgi:hypothetical protein